MKKKIIMLFAALSLGSAALSAQTINAVEEGKYDIKVGDITMTVNAAQGGKIVSYRLGDKEVLSQTRFPNSFGKSNQVYSLPASLSAKVSSTAWKIFPMSTLSKPNSSRSFKDRPYCRK